MTFQLTRSERHRDIYRLTGRQHGPWSNFILESFIWRTWISKIILFVNITLSESTDIKLFLKYFRQLSRPCVSQTDRARLVKANVESKLISFA